MRLCEHPKLANHNLAKVNQQFATLHQEAQWTQAESSHKPLTHDKKTDCGLGQHEAIQDCLWIGNNEIQFSVMIVLAGGQSAVL